MEIIQTNKIADGLWVVTYTVPLECGCGVERKQDVIKSKFEPTIKQLENAIRNKDKGTDV